MVGYYQVSYKNTLSLFTLGKILNHSNRHRGAVYRGLEGNQVENRKARCHYGVRHASVFHPIRHHGQKPYWCKYHEKSMVSDQMTWYIKKVTPYALFTNLLKVIQCSGLLTSWVPQGRLHL